MVSKIRVRLQHGAKAREEDVTQRQFSYHTLCALGDGLCGAKGSCRHFAYIDEAKEVMVIAGQVDMPEAWRVAVVLGGALVIYLLLAHQRGTSPLPLHQSFSASSTPAPKSPPSHHHALGNPTPLDNRLSYSLPCLTAATSNDSLRSVSSANSSNTQENSIQSTTANISNNVNEMSNARWKDYVLSSGFGYRLVLQTRLNEDNAPYIGVAVSLCRGLKEEVGLTDMQHVLVVDALASALANLGKTLRQVTPTKDVSPSCAPAGEANTPHPSRHPPCLPAQDSPNTHQPSTTSSTSLTNSTCSSDGRRYSLQEQMYSSAGSMFIDSENMNLGSECERNFLSPKRKSFCSLGARLGSDFVFPSCLAESSIVPAGSSEGLRLTAFAAWDNILIRVKDAYALVNRTQDTKEIATPYNTRMLELHGELGAKAFGELKEQLRTIRSDKDRVRLLKQAVSESFVTSDQVVQLIAEQVSYDAKNQTAIACHPRLSDPAKFDKVLAALKFPEDREEVKKALGLA